MNRLLVASVAASAMLASVDAGCCTTPTGTCCSGSCQCGFATQSVEVIKDLFDEFRTTHKKDYVSDREEMRRFGIFKDTLKTIDERNKADKEAGGSAEHGITRFADLTQAEFEALYLDARTASHMRKRNATVIATPRGATSGAVDYTGSQTTAVKDQGGCGSCW